MVRSIVRASEASEIITDGLRIYHNPFATHPLPREVFRRDGVVQMWADPKEKALESEQTDNFLQSRSVLIALHCSHDDPMWSEAP